MELDYTCDARRARRHGQTNGRSYDVYRDVHGVFL